MANLLFCSDASNGNLTARAGERARLPTWTSSRQDRDRHARKSVRERPKRAGVDCLWRACHLGCPQALPDESAREGTPNATSRPRPAARIWWQVSPRRRWRTVPASPPNSGRAHPRSGVDLNRSRLSNVYSIRVRSSRCEVSRVVWDVQFQDRREIPGHVEIGRAVTLGRAPGE